MTERVRSQSAGVRNEVLRRIEEATLSNQGYSSEIQKSLKDRAVTSPN